jgi:RNA polymerase sigma-70 factor (ECF subfamily)
VPSADALALALPAMFRAARGILGSDDVAWDAVQEASLRAWRNGTLPHTPGAALRRLAVLSALHIARCARRRRFHEARAAPGELCCAQDPLVDAESGELRASLEAVLRRLSPSHREVFVLFELEGRDYAEIAATLGLPLGTVRSRLSRARRELRARLSRGPRPRTVRGARS